MAEGVCSLRGEGRPTNTHSAPSQPLQKEGAGGWKLTPTSRGSRGGLCPLAPGKARLNKGRRGRSREPAHLAPSRAGSRATGGLSLSLCPLTTGRLWDGAGSAHPQGPASRDVLEDVVRGRASGLCGPQSLQPQASTSRGPGGQAKIPDGGIRIPAGLAMRGKLWVRDGWG